MLNNFEASDSLKMKCYDKIYVKMELWKRVKSKFGYLTVKESAKSIFLSSLL